MASIYHNGISTIYHGTIWVVADTLDIVGNTVLVLGSSGNMVLVLDMDNSDYQDVVWVLDMGVDLVLVLGLVLELRSRRTQHSIYLSGSILFRFWHILRRLLCHLYS